MKKSFLLLTLSLFAVVLSSCNNKEQPDNNGNSGNNGNNGNGGKVVFTATPENLEQAGDAEAFWLPGDQIKLVLDDGSSVNATIVDGAGTATGSFVGDRKSVV